MPRNTSDFPRLAIGDTFDQDAFIATLEDRGFREDDRVDEPGEYVLRGSVFDLFDSVRALPLRLRLIGGTIAAMAWYDPLTQLQIAEEQSVTIGLDGDGSADAARLAAPTFAIDPLSPHGQTIRVGDLVVHEDHGLGRVGGLQSVTLADETQDMIELGFRDDTTRLVPTSQIAKIWRYGGDEGEVVLDKLNGSSWHRRRKELDKAVAKTAKHMVRQAFEKAKRQVTAFPVDAGPYDKFCEGFGFDPTRDQAEAFAAVESDLAAGKPMNRLIAGDVGFGKTEIALRAAAQVVFGGAQVALAAPTNILAAQHLDVFKQRFAPFGIEIALLTGSVKGAERARVLAGLADGSISIVIGTGAVAGRNVVFKNAGLVVVDEEHRLGTRDKNRLRRLASGHMLQMSATPIPRTLMAAMVGLQDISILATPPVARKPVATSFHAPDDNAMKDAIAAELATGGQAFVVVPQVADVDDTRRKIARLFPDASIASVHGQMKQAAMDAAIVAFAQGKHDILVSTTVIEIGLDVPQANCMVVLDAERFGLAQLHQLRGRVGRSDRKAAMLMMSDCHATPDSAAAKRLRKIVAEARLGAGFSLSLADLDMRGGGDLAGDSQNGHIALVGADLYHDLLEATIGEMQGARKAAKRNIAQVTAGFCCNIPHDWLPRTDSRLEIHYRVGHARNSDELEKLRTEFADRFGTPPPEMRNLLDLRQAALLAADMDMVSVSVGAETVKLVSRAKGRLRETINSVEQRLPSADTLVEFLRALREGAAAPA